MKKPLSDRVVIKPLDVNKKTVGGMYIPDSSQEHVNEGIVIQTGQGYYTSTGALLPMEVAVKDKVLFTPHSGTTVKVDGDDCLLMRESDILAVL